MILIRREEEIQNNVFQIPNKSRITRRNSRRGTGHSLDLGVERNGVETKFTFLKENGKPQPTRWWNDSRNLDTQYSKVFLRWLVESRWESTTRRLYTSFTAEASNTVLLNRTSHSVNQLSIYGAVGSWCESLVWSLMKSLRKRWMIIYWKESNRKKKIHW